MSEYDPDIELLARIAKNDAAAAREMVARKLPRLISLGMRMLGNRSEAEDIAQETFIRIWKQAASWQPGEARFDTWMHRVALNLCYDRLRGHKTEALEYHDIPEEEETAELPERKLAAAQQQQLMNAALTSLPVRQREALVLQYYQELSNTESAALMNISVDALESLLSRARRNVRAYLIANEGQGG